MSFEDDFLIDDDEGVVSDVKDELYGLNNSQASTQHNPDSDTSSSLRSSIDALKNTFSSNNSSNTTSVASKENEGTGDSTETKDLKNSHEIPNNNKPHILAPGTTAPAVVVAPKATTTTKITNSANQAPTTNTTPSDVFKKLEEGGSAFFQKVAGFFQQTPAFITSVSSQLNANTHKSQTYDGYSTSFSQEDNESKFLAVYQKFLDALQNAENASAFTILDDFITDFNAQESLRFDGSDLIEKQEREYYGLREKRLALLETAILSGKDVSSITDEEAIKGIAEQNVSRDKAVADGEYQTNTLRAHQLSRGQMFQNIVVCAHNLFIKMLAWPNMTEDEKYLIFACIEEYLVPHIHKKLYCPDRWTDWRFAQLVGSMQFVTPKDFDIQTEIDQNLVNRCGALLVEVNFLQTPRKKIAAFTQVCMHIVNYLSEHLSNTAATANTSAEDNQHRSKNDEFLITLIYILIMTNPPNLLSNISYLITCRSGSELMLSDEGYFFAHVAVAVHFLCKLKESKSSSTISIDGGVGLDWMPMAIDKEAKLLHLIPSLEEARTKNEILEYKKTMQRLAQGLLTKLARKEADSLALKALIQQYPATNYSTEQSEAFKKDPSNFFSTYKYWDSNPDELAKSPAAVALLLNEYKKLLVSEYRRASSTD